MTGFDKYKKLIARLLLAAFFFVLFPFANPGIAYAAPDGNTSGTGSKIPDPDQKSSKTLSGTEDASGSKVKATSQNQTVGQNQTTAKSAERDVKTYKVTPDAMPAYTPYKGMSRWSDRKAVQAPKNTYVLTAATGAAAGDSVLYFAVRYLGEDGNSRSQYVFPGIDAGSKSVAFLEHYANQQSVKDVNYTYGRGQLYKLYYSESGSIDTKLDSWTVQDYAFQTDDAIAKVQAIDVYLAKGKWSVQGLSLYKMESYKGYEEYGLVSGQHFLDFSGYLVADLVKKQPGALTLSTSQMDTVIRIGGEDSNYFDIQEYDAETKRKGYAAENSLYSFRFDFADVAGAGFEVFQNPDMARLTGDMGIVENLVMEIQYRDSHGWNRKVMLPVILSSYIMARNADGKQIYAFAQAGETIAFQGLLPDYDGLNGSVNLKVGKKAQYRIKDFGFKMVGATKKMQSNAIKSNDETIRLAGCSIYKGGCNAVVRGGTDTEGTHLDGATLEFVFERPEPMLYFTTSTVDGRSIKEEDNITLYGYKSGSPVVAKAGLNDTFMVTLYTSDKANAGTKADVDTQFFYLDEDGDAARTQIYSAKKGAESFLGPWKSKTGGDYISENAFERGGAVSFLIEAKGVSQFTKAEVSHKGDGFWEMKNLTIDYVESYSARKAYIAPKKIQGTNYWITRDMVSAEVFNLAKTTSKITDETGKAVSGDGTKEGERKQLRDEEGRLIFDGDTPVYEDDQGKKEDFWTYGGQLFIDNQTLNIDFGKGAVAEMQDLDYSEVRFSMTHEQTQIDWGFFKKRKTFNVAVKVAKDSDVDLGNGDAGSVNYFYFQLVFKNGNSAYVQANQQLAGDAFRSGNTEIFTIATNRDYGELLRINIVPEDLATDSKPFDKLNIDSITVTEETSGGTHISYVFDQIGWIDIDYRDEAENSSIRGLKARTADELAKSYSNPYKQRSVKLLCEVSTLPWESDEGLRQFQGSVTAKVQYIKASDNSLDSIEFDAVQYLAAYQNKAATTMEAASNVGQSAAQGAISDPAIMFCPGKTDRFVMPAIADLKSVKSIAFTATPKNSEASMLSIGKVTLSQIVEDGPMQLTNTGELYRNFKTKKLAINSDSKTVTKRLPVGQPTTLGPIEFTKNEIVWSSEQWATPVSRIPDSSDDTVNIYVYPTVPGGNAQNFYNTLTDPTDQNEGGAVVHANLSYNIPYSQKMAAACDLKVGRDGQGHTLYYATGVQAPNYISMEKLAVQCTDTGVTFNHAIIQHVRSDVVVDTSSCNFMDTTAVIKLSANVDISNGYVDDTQESILLAFGSGTKEMALQSVNNDVAVAFTYTSSIDGGKKEYTSPYMYLTDAGYTSVREGLMAEVKFDLPYVRQITGYRIAAYGNIKGSISASAGVVYHIDERNEDLMGDRKPTKTSIRSYSSFAESYELSEKVSLRKATSYSMSGEKSVTPISITFTSTETPKMLDDAKEAAVRMKLAYTDVIEQPRLMLYEDIRNYIQGSRQSFTPEDASDNSVTIRFFLSEMKSDLSIQNLELCPYDPDVEIYLAGDPKPKNGAAAAVDEMIMGLQNSPETVYTDDNSIESMLYRARSASWSLAKVVYDAGFGTNVISREVDQVIEGMKNGAAVRLNKVAFTTYVAKNQSANEQVFNHTLQMVATGGDVITGAVTLRSTTAGFTAKAYKMVGDAGEAVPPEILVIPEGSRNFYFYVPKNPTGAIVIYRIDVSPVDAPDLVDSIYISVESEEITMTTTFAVNGGAETPVRDHNSILVGQAGDVLKGRVVLTNSDQGFTVSAFRMVGDAGQDVTEETVKTSAKAFSFKVPENHSGSVVQYKLEITSVETGDLKDTIYISVESTPEPEKDTEQEADEGSTEKEQKSSEEKATPTSRQEEQADREETSEEP